MSASETTTNCGSTHAQTISAWQHNNVKLLKPTKQSPHTTKCGPFNANSPNSCWTPFQRSTTTSFIELTLKATLAVKATVSGTVSDTSTDQNIPTEPYPANQQYYCWTRGLGFNADHSHKRYMHQNTTRACTLCFQYQLERREQLDLSTSCRRSSSTCPRNAPLPRPPKLSQPKKMNESEGRLAHTAELHDELCMHTV